MKKILLLLSFFYSSFCFAQQYTLPATLVTRYLPDQSTESKDIIVESKIGKDDFHEIILSYKGQNDSFKLKPLTFPNFKAKFKLALVTVLKANAIDPRTPEDSAIENDIAFVFTQIVTYNNSEEARPEVATIFLKDHIPVYYDSDNEIDQKIKTELTDVQVEISFFGGFIEKIQVNGKVGATSLSFNNKYSIGISSTKNIGQLNDYRLFSNERFTATYFKKNLVQKNAEDRLLKLKDDLSKATDEVTIAESDFTLSDKKNHTAKAALESAKNNMKSITTLQDFERAKVQLAVLEEDLKNAEEESKARAITLKDALAKKNNLVAEEVLYEAQKQEDDALMVAINAIEEAKNNEEANTMAKKKEIPLADALKVIEAKKVLKAEESKKSLRLDVNDVIRYVKKVDVNANDISPVPQLVILDENEKETKLFREESSKLFEAVVYTDFLGVFDEENPNGIIQTEINKEFNIGSKRFDFLPAFIEAIGFFNYFTAQFQFSKIEKNNKFLLPSVYESFDVDNNPTSESYYSPISIYQYRNYSIGGNLNILFMENQNAKISTTLDAGFLFGRSGIKDTAEQVEGRFVNNIELPVELKFRILPERRFSFIISDRLSWFELLDSKENFRSIEDNKITSRNHFLNTFNVGMNLDISSSGKLFLRYKLIHELDNINANFSQLQFGYSFYLLQKNGVKKKE